LQAGTNSGNWNSNGTAPDTSNSFDEGNDHDSLRGSSTHANAYSLFMPQYTSLDVACKKYFREKKSFSIRTPIAKEGVFYPERKKDSSAGLIERKPGHLER